MKIDIEPEILTAEGRIKAAMELYEYKKMFTFLTKKGEEYTVLFNDIEDSEKSIHNFCPTRTVSEMKKAWETGFDETIKLYKDSVKKKEHPYWTHFDEELKRTVKSALPKNQIEFFESEIKRLEENFQGELTFVAYVL